MAAHDPSASRAAATEANAPAGAHARAGRESGPGSASNGAPYSAKRELGAAATNLGEALAYLGQFIGAKLSKTIYGVRKLALLAMLGAVVGIAGASIIVTSAVLLVVGLSDAIASFLPARWAWAGEVIVGLSGILLAVGAVYIVMRRAASVGKQVALEQYRLALREQRRRFGHDAFSRSVAAAAEQDMAARRAPAGSAEEIAALREKRQSAQKAQRQVDEDFARLTGRKRAGGGDA